MHCELNPNHDPYNYCGSCGTCFDCLGEEAAEMVKKYKDVLKKIIAAHHQSDVDWDAMREAEKLLGSGQDQSTK